MTREEAIKIVRNIYQTDAEKEALGTLIPELAVSEDERMIKAITHILYENYTDAAVIEGVEIAEIVTWLEKQKGRKPAEVCYGPKGDPDPAGVWKPSEEQIRIYEDAISCIPDFYKPKSTLKALLEQLKKL